MLGYRTRRNIKKAYTGICRLFNNKCEKANESICPNFLHNIYQTSQRTNFSTAILRTRHLHGAIKNSENSPNLCRLNKLQCRSYGFTENGLPDLTSESMIPYPSVFAPTSNLILTYLVIRPYIDGTFSLGEFVTASKQVVQIVSRKLACQDLDGIRPMVSTALLNEIEGNLPKFSKSQLQELATEADDIYLAAANSIKLINEANTKKKFLEITTIHHALRGYKDLAQASENFMSFSQFQNQFQTPNQNPNQNPFQQLQNMQFSMDENKSYILNYKFLREYDPNSGPGDWMLTGIIHYKQKIKKNPFAP